METKTYTIDATGKALGRLATEVVALLRGKNKPSFLPYKDAENVVIVKNIKEMKITGKKMEQKRYFHHSRYLGGEKFMTLKVLFKENPGEVLKKAVYGMLPKNRLRAKQIKRLKFE